MNYQIQNKLRRIYREVEKGKSDWKRYTNDPVELANIMIDKDVEVRSELTDLITAIFEDIADPDRSDSFTDFGDKVESIVLGIVSEDPEIAYDEEEIAERVAEHDEFFQLTVDQSEKKALDLIYSKKMQDVIHDRLRDMADLKQMRKDPDKYFAAPA